MYVCVCAWVNAHIKEEWVVYRQREVDVTQVTRAVVEILTAGRTHLIDNNESVNIALTNF